uniref:Uncharacterized protein n=1 Tax=Theileria annulata TaxID=5874 RepID=A0A3B0MWK0_THEAN
MDGLNSRLGDVTEKKLEKLDRLEGKLDNSSNSVLKGGMRDLSMKYRIENKINILNKKYKIILKYIYGNEILKGDYRGLSDSRSIDKGGDLRGGGDDSRSIDKGGGGDRGLSDRRGDTSSNDRVLDNVRDRFILLGHDILFPLDKFKLIPYFGIFFDFLHNFNDINLSFGLKFMILNIAISIPIITKINSKILINFHKRNFYFTI